MAFWNRKKKEELRSEQISEDDFIGLLLKAGIFADEVTREMALNVAALEGCIEFISNTVAMIPIKLYEEVDGKVKEVKDDNRVTLLNDDTRDTLTAFDLKKSLVRDYLLVGNGYAYINKLGTKIDSINYVKAEDVCINKNADPIFKDYDIYVGANKYKPFEFIKLLRNTRDGSTGEGIIESNPTLLSVAYNSLKYENILAKTGGNKKGFIESEKTLDREKIDLLKEQWNKMYSGNTENCVVLNKGITFKESTATPTEMQMNENKITNNDEICKILNVPPSILGGDGKANENDYEKSIKLAVLPILNSFISSLNKDLLQEKEKKSFYFGFDANELLKGDIEKRFKAYEIGIKNKILGVNEARYKEDLEPIDALNNIIVLGLNDVLYNTETKTIYTPNTDKTSSIINKNTEEINLKGGEVSEN